MFRVGGRGLDVSWWGGRRRTRLELHNAGAEDTVLFARGENADLGRGIIEGKCVALARHVGGYIEVVELLLTHINGEGVIKTSNPRSEDLRKEFVEVMISMNCCLYIHSPKLNPIRILAPWASELSMKVVHIKSNRRPLLLYPQNNFGPEHAFSRPRIPRNALIQNLDFQEIQLFKLDAIPLKNCLSNEFSRNTAPDLNAHLAAIQESTSCEPEAVFGLGSEVVPDVAAFAQGSDEVDGGAAGAFLVANNIVWNCSQSSAGSEVQDGVCKAELVGTGEGDAFELVVGVYQSRSKDLSWKDKMRHQRDGIGTELDAFVV